jgi:peptidoglycan/xylan/chitin deacetylase (PgdA/CDA1 family)
MDAIFTFHSIDDGGSVLSYSPSDLDAFLDLLASEAVPIVPLADLLRPRPAEAGPRAALTFDDGCRSARVEALPRLVRRGVPATLFAVSEWVGKTNGWSSQPAGIPSFDLMDWSELREWRDAGLQVGSHSAHHVPLVGLGDAEWAAELRGSRQRIEDELQIPVEDFAYPYGTCGDEAERRVGEVYRSAVTTDLRFADGAPRFRLPRIETYYLRGPRDHAPLFGARTRLHLGWRAALRGIRRRLQGTPGGSARRSSPGDR